MTFGAICPVIEVTRKPQEPPWRMTKGPDPSAIKISITPREKGQRPEGGRNK